MASFEGCFTAIVTPYKGTGIKTRIDWEGFRRLIEFQNEGGVDGIVPCGTTGESPTTSHAEHNKLIDVVIEHCRGRVIAGTGSNCTWEAIAMSTHAKDAGAHATLQVCPYYNRPSQEGLYKHFAAIAEAVDIPHILYNIPSRSGREIAPQTMARLAAEYSNIIGVKEASGRPEVWKAIREACGKDFLILSGNDGDTYALMREYGARGVISVASNLIPKRMRAFVRSGLEGKFEDMAQEHSALKELFEVLFIDTNPVPVKEALNLMGLPGGGFRLPLCETTNDNRIKIRETLKQYGLISA
ncbi:MAG: 4-hydroxy-tetrahydrodipicolinate synthase [Candidatus Micrarchaeia archaeon]